MHNSCVMMKKELSRFVIATITSLTTKTPVLERKPDISNVSFFTLTHFFDCCKQIKPIVNFGLFWVNLQRKKADFLLSKRIMLLIEVLLLL